MPDYSAEIAALRSAIASGAKRIRFRSAGEEREVEYPSFDDLRRRLAYLEEIAAQRPRPVAGFARFSRGER